MRKSSLRHHSRRGFTLLEVLLVLVIIGVIMAMVVPALFGRQEEALKRTTMMAIKNTEQALQMYSINNLGTYPSGSRDEAFSVLLQPPNNSDGTKVSPYVEKIPKDAWDQVLFYEYPNTRVATAIKPAIWSSGPNRKNDNGEGDDINNWKELLQ